MTTSVFVGIPSHDTLPALFAYDLARLVAARRPDVDVSLNLVAGTYVHCARQAIADRALLERSSHVLWIDSDMRFPPGSLGRLLDHDVPIVGINYSTRSASDPKFVAVKDGERVVTSPDSTGLEDVDALGFGLVLMRTEVLSSILRTSGRPFFGYEWIPERRNWLGEDFYFCRKAKDAGIPLAIDHDLSKDCSHIGSMEYTTEFAHERLNPLVPA